MAPPGRDPLRQARRRNAAEADRAAHGLIRGDGRLSEPRSSWHFRLGLRPAGAALRNRPSSRSGNSRSANRRRKPAGRCRAGTSRAGVMPEIDEPPLSPLGRAWVTRPEPLSSAFRFAESTPVCAPVHKLALINWLGVPGTAVLRRRCGNGSLCARHRLPLDRFPSAQRMAPRVAAPSRSTSLKRGVSIIQRLQSYPVRNPQSAGWHGLVRDRLRSGGSADRLRQKPPRGAYRGGVTPIDCCQPDSRVSTSVCCNLLRLP